MPVELTVLEKIATVNNISKETVIQAVLDIADLYAEIAFKQANKYYADSAMLLFKMVLQYPGIEDKQYLYARALSGVACYKMNEAVAASDKHAPPSKIEALCDQSTKYFRDALRNLATELPSSYLKRTILRQACNLLSLYRGTNKSDKAEQLRKDLKAMN